MIILISIVIGIVIGLLSKGTLLNLAYSIRAPYLVILSIIPEIFTGYLSKALPSIFPNNLWILVLIQYLLLFAFLIKNTHVWSIFIVGVGTVLNFAVIMLNGARMPVSSSIYQMQGMEDTIEKIVSGKVPEYFIMSEKVSLWFLGDVIPVPFFNAGLGSVGDIFMMIGLSIFIVMVMKKDASSSQYNLKKGKHAIDRIK